MGRRERGCGHAEVETPVAAQGDHRRLRAGRFHSQRASERPAQRGRTRVVTWADPRMVDPGIEPSARAPNGCYAGVPGARSGQADLIARWIAKRWRCESPPAGRVTVG